MYILLKQSVYGSYNIAICCIQYQFRLSYATTNCAYLKIKNKNYFFWPRTIDNTNVYHNSPK